MICDKFLLSIIVPVMFLKVLKPPALVARASRCRSHGTLTSTMTSNTDRLDLVIFGATGFTGRHVVTEMTRIALEYPGLTWALAGRSSQKMATLRQEVTKKSGVDLSSIKLIVADISDDNSLKNMCGQAKVLVNCCGPFVKFGEPVVAAAIESKTHYVDVSGETQFIELLEQKYSSAARVAHTCVVNACGLSSAPADLGVLYLQKHFHGTLNSVESYLITQLPPGMLIKSIKNGIVRYSSWESVINGMAHVTLKKMQQSMLPPMEPELKRRFIIHKNLNKWCVPFPAADAAMVARTQRHLASSSHERPAQYQPYITFPSIFTAIGIIIAGVLLFIFSKMTWTRRLLLKYPRLCSFGLVTYGDPKEEVLDDSRFQYELIGNGWSEGADLKEYPDKTVVSRISLSGVDPAYVGTAVILIYSAITILKEKDKIPSTGGIMSPGVAFKDTSIIEKLQANDITFEIIN